MMVRKSLPSYKNHLAIPFVNAILSRLLTTFGRLRPSWRPERARERIPWEAW
jgi:hypothetical protein